MLTTSRLKRRSINYYIDTAGPPKSSLPADRLIGVHLEDHARTSSRKEEIGWLICSMRYCRRMADLRTGASSDIPKRPLSREESRGRSRVNPTIRSRQMN